MSLKTLIKNTDDAFKQVGTDIHGIKTNIGQITNLDSEFTSADANDVVKSLNYLNEQIKSGAASAISVDDAAGDAEDQSKTWSAKKIKDEVTAAANSAGDVETKVGDATGFTGAAAEATNLTDAVKKISDALETKASATDVVKDDAPALTSTYSSTKIDQLLEPKATKEELAALIKDDAEVSDQSHVLSVKATNDLVAAKVAAVIDGAPEAFDTLKELADYVESDKSGAAAMTQSINNKVPFDKTISITDEQKKFVAQTLGIGDLEKDFVSTYTTARDASA